ncbi:MAG: RdgB/HAM1 family non-canonical purine NTP pyrophosphatase [Candidatus Levybacteria bacterium]|nr:RdgB/HAM1 family non-canonical purine NTP pyrophosphatase [Candidatus Levybacteria bacterium]
MRKIVFVTGNKWKAKETEEILNTKLQISEIELPEIQETDLEKVALHKLTQAFKILRKPVIIDDVSFEVEAWNGFPGPLIKWLLKAGDGPSLLLKMLEKEKNRRAYARLAIGYHNSKKAYLFLSKVKGSISHEIRGDNGFGWDRVFIPDGYKETFAEMDPKLKNSISHRAIALKKFSNFLNKEYRRLRK